METNFNIKPVDVSCIIINYNTAKYTLACVKSIITLENHLSNYEIIVVDNASAEDDYLWLLKEFKKLNLPQLKLFRSKKNVGFGAGNMLGVQISSPCNYYAFINNDTLHVSENSLQRLMNFMNQNETIGIVSPQMLDQDKNFRVTIDHFSSLGREILRRPLLEKLFPKTYLNRKVRYQKPTKVHYVQGSYMFIRADAFNQIGGFDDNLFLYYEESDVSRRLLKQLNLSTYLFPDLEYIHYKSASTKKNILIKIEQKISLLYYIRKHYGFIQYKLLLGYYIIRYFFSSILKPKYWKLFFVLLRGAPTSLSLKQNQTINNLS
ncbi:glycosyltransferase family 2 protein [Mesonia sp. K4-1]|uniref:glycosyltransferase family 2 protein n=1 Tax=Mesonia sp. K4-1 TaxID=2602760 RepID=UPI0011CAA257|nr:glycosyltransferase family 2 protein [Mesonia sp. K4-1]TXK72921.1 glycosyltransferase family 2 protein [Mesonia sp. K4-1]